MSWLDSYRSWIHNKLELEKPSWASFEDWEIWHEEAKAKEPFRYWIAETLPDKIDDIWRYIKRPFSQTKYWIRYRIFDRYHIINTGLKPDYYDFDTRCLHAMFSMLVEYVETQLAWKHSMFDTESRAK